MATTEIWVPVVWHDPSGTEPGYYSPALPEGTGFTTNNGIPADMDPASPTYGHPCNKNALVRVDEKDLPAIEAYLVKEGYK